MQPQLVLYIATVAGAASLFLLMPKPGKDLRLLGGLLGAATLGLLWLALAPLYLLGDGGRLDTGLHDGQTPFYYIFSALAIAAGVRVVTHTRPVYAALWFVMVVLASAGLLLTLSAEFMAFAMLIIYGGAILVTYMFVIMLATPPRSSDDPDEGPAYERFAAEPLWACIAGFLLLAVVLSVGFEPMTANPAAAMRPGGELIASTLADRDEGGQHRYATPAASEANDGDGEAAAARLTNVERIGLDLFQGHPLAIELAGVILLLALVGAIVIARTQVPREDEDAPEAGPEAVRSSV